MSEELCRQVDRETQPPNAKIRCAEFDRQCPDCLCEQFSFGNGSPGCVGDHEKIVRFLFKPRDFPDGNPTPAAFSDVASLGLSVTREQADDRLLEDVIAMRLARMPADSDWHAVAIAKVSDIRALVRRSMDGRDARAFSVYDTAVEGNHLHAEVCGTRYGRKLRDDLRNLFTVRLRDQYRGGRIKPPKPCAP